MNSRSISRHINISARHVENKHETVKDFRLRKLGTVRKRACWLQESFYPTVEVPYAAVRTRMATLLGVVDRMSVLAYLGRPESTQKSVMDQTVRYLKSGTTVPKRHYFKRKLKAVKGYIDIFGLGYVYQEKDEWFVHWNHAELVNEVFQKKAATVVAALVNEVIRKSEKANPLTPPQRVDEEIGNVTINNFSLSNNTSQGNENSTPKDHTDTVVMESEQVDGDREERETICEREISVSCREHDKQRVLEERFSRKNVNRNSIGRFASKERVE